MGSLSGLSLSFGSQGIGLFKICLQLATPQLTARCRPEEMLLSGCCLRYSSFLSITLIRIAVIFNCNINIIIGGRHFGH